MRKFHRKKLNEKSETVKISKEKSARNNNNVIVNQIRTQNSKLITGKIKLLKIQNQKRKNKWKKKKIFQNSLPKTPKPRKKRKLQKIQSLQRQLSQSIALKGPQSHFNGTKLSKVHINQKINKIILVEELHCNFWMILCRDKVRMISRVFSLWRYIRLVKVIHLRIHRGFLKIVLVQ